MPRLGAIPIRRAQLVSLFGPGALNVGPDGTSVITAGLDHWYTPGGPEGPGVDVDEFKLHEWRLESELGVDHFRLPPDFRVPRGRAVPNASLSVPVLRFPQWHLCNYCRTLVKVPLTSRETTRCAFCVPKPRHRAPRVTQVRFIALCDGGHVADFPWREWAHSSAAPACDRRLRLLNQGAAGLSSTRIGCECGRSRSLGGVTEASDQSSFLTRTLDANGAPFFCPGTRPWLGSEDGESCDRPLRASLRGASNAYFAQLRTAIQLPRSRDSNVSADLIALLQRPPLSTAVGLLEQLGRDISPSDLRGLYGMLLVEYTDEQVSAALSERRQANADPPAASAGPDEAFRHAEFAVLQQSSVTSSSLRVAQPDRRSYQNLPAGIAAVNLIESLTETRAFTGFTRLNPAAMPSRDIMRRLLWRVPPPPGQDWLPAYEVRGEGFFVQLDEVRLREWERDDAVRRRVQALADRYSRLSGRSSLTSRAVTPRFVLLHTFAHILINQLTFESGYSTAALRERLYGSDDEPTRMAAVLIYTAAGDSEGTLGGLVQKGRPGNLESVVAEALGQAGWCSADPVCMEMGAKVGQGPDACNIAACHNCALLPETACEEFNRFLDRGVVVGADGVTGFFAH